MVTVVIAVVVTAVITFVCTAAVTRRSLRASINEAIGGRPGADPVTEHSRLIDLEEQNAATCAAQADLMSLTLDAMGSGVIIVDKSGREQSRNRFARTVSMRSHEQTLVDAAASDMLSVALTGEPAEREFEVFGPPPKVLFMHSVPVSRADEIIGALVVIDDVTDSHRIDKTRRDFVANLSHELRTPVGAVSLLGEMLEGERDEATRDRLTRRIALETQRMTETIDDLLELSRIESEEQSYDDTIDLVDLLEAAVNRSRVNAEVSGVHLGVVAPKAPITILGNRDQLLSALNNLIENAVKYSSEGDSVSVRVRVNDEIVSIAVQDTGCGIPVRDLDRIFERFYRVDHSRDASTGGTGIGLSIVRHVALNHDGTVSVRSAEGEGSTFNMSIPLNAVDPNTGRAMTEPEVTD